MTAHHDRCLNCQSNLEGPFCSQCGQAKSARLIPVKAWMSEFSGAFLALDSKLFRTLKRVLLQPGQATVDFANGQRVPYSSPARVYIIVSAISIAAMTLSGTFSSNDDTTSDLAKKVQFLFPFVNLLSPFFTAGVLAVFQRQQFFQLHLAFSLHFWTFLVAIGTPLVLLPPDSIWMLIATAGLTAIAIGHLLIAHRRVYTMPVLKRLLICGAVLLSMLLTSVLIMFLLFAFASLL